MAGLSSALNISVRSLLLNQTALSTISHNLANVNNPNFSRQEVQPSAQFAAGFGAGVTLDSIVRRVDSQVQAELSGQVSNRSFAQTISRFEGNIEIIFGRPNDNTGLDNVLADIFAQLNNVAGLPESSSLRLNAVNQFQFLAERLNDTSDRLIALQQELDGVVNNQLVSITRALEQIHDINNEIALTQQTSIGGQNTNDLEDTRQEQILFLSEHLKINVLFDKDNRALISTESGQQLVTGNTHAQLERIASAGPGLFAGIGTRSISADGSVASFVLPLNTNNLTAGSLKAIVDVRDSSVPNILAQVDEFARVAINEFNRVHSRGVGTPPPSSLTSAALTTPGTDLFTEIGLVPGSSFDISVVDPLTGAPVNTTTVTLPGAGPFSGAALAATINAALGGAGFPGTVSASFAAGQLTIEDTSGNTGIVLGNDPDDFLGSIALNPILEGTDAATIAVRPDILTQPGLLATARMRAADGGLSFNNNANAIALAQVSTTNFGFNAAGSLTSQVDTLSGYFSTITSNLAVQLQDNSRRLEFTQQLEVELQLRNSSVSGVNLDEELANLIVFQNSFQASSRVISTIDELFDTLLNII